MDIADTDLHVKKFQKDQKLPETGTLDPDTIDRLHAEHGG